MRVGEFVPTALARAGGRILVPIRKGTAQLVQYVNSQSGVVHFCVYPEGGAVQKVETNERVGVQKEEWSSTKSSVF